MRDAVLAALSRHKDSAAENEKYCRLDIHSKDGVLPKTEMMWRHIWGYTENEINKALSRKEGLSLNSKKGHDTRKKSALDKTWEVGTKYDTKFQKYRSNKSVWEALEVTSGKSIVCVTSTLIARVSKFQKECKRVRVDFDELSFLSNKKAQQHKVLLSMF